MCHISIKTRCIRKKHVRLPESFCGGEAAQQVRTIFYREFVLFPVHKAL